MFKMDFRKKITAFLVILSLLAVYAPTALFAASASAPTVSISAESITANSVIIKVTIEENGSTITSGTVTLPDGSNQTVTSTQTFPVSNLTPGTPYNYSASINYSYDDDTDPLNVVTVTGMENPSGSFTTLAQPSVTVNSVVVSNVGTGTADVTANFSATNCNADTSSYFTVSPSDGVTINNPQLSSNTLKATLSGLVGGTTYTITAYVNADNGATQANGQTTHSHPVVSVAPTLTVSNPTFTISGVYANVSFTGMLTNSGSALVSETGLVYSTSTSSPSLAAGGAAATNCTKIGTKTNIAANTTNTNLSGSVNSTITAGSTVYVRAYAISGSTITYSGSVGQVTTSVAKAPSVAPTIVNSYTDKSAVIKLDVTSDGGSTVTERGVVYSTSTTSPTTSNSKVIASGTTGSTTVSITGLSSETTYYVRSYATNSVNTTYGTYASFKTTATQAANAPSVTTSSPASSSITSSSADIPINITNNNGYTVTEYGVVYSRYDENSTPTITGYRCYTEYYTGSKSGSVTITLTGLDPDTEYAVRAYAKNSKGYGYGTVRTFTTDDDDGSPVVLTQSTSRVSDTEIDVEIKVTSSYTITEKGVVYSRTNSSPKLNSSSTSKQEISGTSSGTSTVSLTGLISGSSYYVRAYATNRNGTSYGSVKEVTANDYTVTTNAVSDITPSSAIVGGTVSSSINSDVLERGVVYSRSSKSPTVNDTRVRSDRTTYGSYSLTLTGLGFNETYYVRAYIRTADGYSYGSTVTFSTNTNLTVTVLYKTEDGQQVGSQNITAAHNATITQTALNVPYGYTLVNSYYSYNVTATTTTTVLVRKTLQSAYMEGSSNYLFEPDKKITRIEVAKMIHSLKGNVYVGEGKTYHDMPTVQAELAALKYVTAMSYMVGDPDGKFRPYDPITRAEVVVICNTVYGLQSNDLTNPFSDIENHWAKNYIIIGYKNKALYGYPDGTFKPQSNMTRAEAVIVFANAEKRDLTPLTTTPFSDVPASHWAYKYIMNAAIPKK